MDILTSCLLVLFWVAVWYVGAWATHRRSGSWPPSKVESENSPFWGACVVMSTVNAFVCTAICVPALAQLLFAPHAAQFKHRPSYAFCSGGPATGFDFTIDAVAFCGQSFIIRLALDAVLQLIHNILTVEEALHHAVFFAAGWLIRSNCVLPLNAAFLMAMEVSTPFLNYYLFFRGRYPFRNDVNAAKTAFGVLFLVFRMILNTYGAVILVKAYLGQTAGMPRSMPCWQQVTVVVLVVAGACLQMYWGARIVQGLLRIKREKKEAHSEPMLADGHH
mmetsp:Transcript_97131/g.302944  ORF Transcript_97131/g.302944 Transcript_97131/m.302944 type:complete len:276 (-) Transcript_97131:179-1006(-)